LIPVQSVLSHLPVIVAFTVIVRLFLVDVVVALAVKFVGDDASMRR